MDEKKEKFLRLNIFKELEPLNRKEAIIKVFTESQMELVITRIIQFGKGVGLYGIELFDGDEFIDCHVKEQYSNNPSDAEWMTKAFNRLVERAHENKAKMQFQYSATYYVPEVLLDSMNTKVVIELGEVGREYPSKPCKRP